MKINRNPERTAEVLDLIRKSFMDNPRTEIHISDLLYPRKAYFSRLHPLPPSDEEIQYFVVGKGHEDALHRVAGLVHIPQKEWNGIKYSMDFYQGHPVEMKTRRRYAAKEGEEESRYAEYLRQLKMYCAVENSLEGELWVWSLLEKTDEYKTGPEYVSYTVNFDSFEVISEREALLRGRDTLTEAIALKSHLKLPLCPEWMCRKTTTKVIEGKEPYCITCRKAFASDKNIDKHAGSKAGAGHQTRRGVYETTTKPICRWFDLCLGHNRLL